MAVWVYKENEEPELIDALMLDAAIAGGWSVDKDLKPVTEEEVEEHESVDEDLVRAKAKEAGIKSWHVKSVAKLQEELDELDAD